MNDIIRKLSQRVTFNKNVKLGGTHRIDNISVVAKCLTSLSTLQTFVYRNWRKKSGSKENICKYDHLWDKYFRRL